MKFPELKNLLEQECPGSVARSLGESLLLERPSDLAQVAACLKYNPQLRFDYLASVTGTDFIDFLEVLYHFYSMEKKTGPVVLRVRVKKDSARVPSLVPLFRGAKLQEREVWDMLGIHFDGHPCLERLLMWEGFASFPLRKDFVQEDSEILEMTDIRWLERHGVRIPDDLRKKAEDLEKTGGNAKAERPKPGAL
ncbi:MAG: NADH-quinone oxidoreductase subunit C [Candidatus Omnitrophota bacterium]